MAFDDIDIPTVSREEIEDELDTELPEVDETNSVDVTEHFEKNLDVSAILTKSQFSYLVHPEHSDIERKSPQERTMRSRIRDRLMVGIQDLETIHKSAESRDIKKAFELTEGVDMFKPASETVGLIFNGMSRSSDFDTGQDATTERAITMFEQIVAKGLSALYTQRGKVVNEIKVSIDVKFGQEVDQISTEELDQLPLNKLNLLYENDRISEKEYITARYKRINH
jgi:hypothetical protein